MILFHGGRLLSKIKSQKATQLLKNYQQRENITALEENLLSESNWVKQEIQKYHFPMTPDDVSRFTRDMLEKSRQQSGSSLPLDPDNNRSSMQGSKSLLMIDQKTQTLLNFENQAAASGSLGRLDVVT